MKRLLSILLASSAFGTFAAQTDAALIDRGGGLIYDTDLNITWQKDADVAFTNSFGVSGIEGNGRMNWNTAQSWIDAMNSANYLGYSDWRLPTTAPQNLNTGFDGTTGYGYNITTGSEMGHLFYTELGNAGLYKTNGAAEPAWQAGVANTGPFINLLHFYNYNYTSGGTYTSSYWSSGSNGSGPDPTHGVGPYLASSKAWDFFVGDGSQNAHDKSSTYLYAWAVRNGDVAQPAPATAPVPEPGTMLLLGSGVAGLVAFRKRLGF